MKWPAFVTPLLAGLGAVVGMPLTSVGAKARSSPQVDEAVGEPSLRHRLPREAVVKWEAWREWRDPVTGEKQAAFEVRYTVVPTAYLPKDGSPMPFDPNRTFLTYVPVGADGNELGAVMYPFYTYAVSATGRERIAALRQAIHDGTVMLAFKRPQDRNVRRPIAGAWFTPIAGEWSFVRGVQWQVAWQNAHINDTRMLPYEFGDEPGTVRG